MELSSLELEEKFNDYLDVRYGSLKIGWNEYEASTLLHAVDSIAYEQQYSDWLHSNGYEEL